MSNLIVGPAPARDRHLHDRLDEDAAAHIALFSSAAIAFGSWSRGGLALSQSVAVRRAIGEERRRFAQDLHDQSGQDLAILRIGLKRLARHVDSAEGIVHLERLYARLDHIDEDLRRIVENLLPRSFEGPDLATNLRRMFAEWSESTGIETRLDWRGDPYPATTQIGRSVHRILQEALSNIGKHATGVTRATVRLSNRPDRIVVTIVDDGALPGRSPGSSTFASSKGRPCFGLSGMRDRVSRVGGRLRLLRPPGGGLMLGARFPHAACDAGSPPS